MENTDKQRLLTNYREKIKSLQTRLDNVVSRSLEQTKERYTSAQENIRLLQEGVVFLQIQLAKLRTGRNTDPQKIKTILLRIEEKQHLLSVTQQAFDEFVEENKLMDKEVYEASVLMPRIRECKRRRESDLDECVTKKFKSLRV